LPAQLIINLHESNTICKQLAVQYDFGMILACSGKEVQVHLPWKINSSRACLKIAVGRVVLLIRIAYLCGLNDYCT
jgi:hypothetical protein